MVMTREGSPGEGLADRIHALIQDEPGIHTSELARRLDVAPSTVTYHLERLQSSGVVRIVRIGHINHIVANGPNRPMHLDVLLSPAVRAILDVMASGGIHSPRDLQRSTGIGEKTVRRALQRLEESGLVESDGAYHPRYWVTEGWRSRSNEPEEGAS